MFTFMKKGLVISSALLTMGFIISPDFEQEVYAEDSQKLYEDKPFIYKVNQDSYELFHDVLPVKTDQYIHRNISSAELLNEYIIKQAHEQSLMKFGDATTQKIRKPFEQRILPKLNEKLRETTNTLTEEDWTQLKVTNIPASGLGERILHLYNEKTGKDVFRFHVRRDHPPNKGYYFNFHYHTYLDQYETHHDLGTLYWGKDIPQKWNGIASHA